MESALTFLQQYYDDSEEFLNRITGAETLIAQITSEIKQQSMHWYHNARQNSCRLCLSEECALCSVTDWFQSPGGKLLQHGIQKFVPQYNKCLSSGGEYVQKYLLTDVSVLEVNTLNICSDKFFYCFCKWH